MSIENIAQDYVASVEKADYIDLIERLYSEDAESVEACETPGQERIVKGRDALLAKSRAFDDSFEVHSQSISGPWPHGQDKFAVHMVFEMTHRASGHRNTTDEIAVLTVRDGKIAKEEFFYTR